MVGVGQQAEEEAAGGSVGRLGARWKQGLDLLKRIRDLGVNTPVLVMSGAWDTQKEAEAFLAGAVGYLRKPFSLRELDCSVALALGPRAASG